jgi:hypothetical protein
VKTGAAAPATAIKMAGATATLTATGGVACGVCCVLPFALPGAVLAVSGGVLAWLGRLMPWMTAVAFTAVAAGWLWVIAQTLRARRRRPASSTLLTMGVATLLMVMALAWPHLERLLVALLRR